MSGMRRRLSRKRLTKIFKSVIHAMDVGQRDLASLDVKI